MATKYPYISGTGGLLQILQHFRKAFPQSVSADTLKKLGYAPNNEGAVIYILRFVGLIEEDGKKTDEASKVFSEYDDSEFQKKFGELVEVAYKDLFSLHGEDTWDLDRDKLISYFRRTDETSAVTGRRQAQTFKALSAFSGHTESPPTRKSAAARPSTKTPGQNTERPKKIPPEADSSPTPSETKVRDVRPHDVGLTVRIEINLPADGDQETYDRIFRSIRENLINGE